MWKQAGHSPFSDPQEAKSSHVIDRAFWPNRLQAATGQNARSTSEVRPGTMCSQSLR